MKHTQWLRLQAEGDRIVASFRADGFNCCKQPRRLSWQISKDSTGCAIAHPLLVLLYSCCCLVLSHRMN